MMHHEGNQLGQHTFVSKPLQWALRGGSLVSEISFLGLQFGEVFPLHIKLLLFLIGLLLWDGGGPDGYY